MKKSDSKIKKSKKITINMSAFAISVIFVFIGIGILALSYIKNDSKNIWGNFISPLIGAIGTTIASAAGVSIFVEISTIKGVVKSAFDDVLECEFPLESYSNCNLKKLTNRIAAQRLGIEENMIEKSIYDSMEQKLLETTSGLYYKYHNSTIYIYPIEKDGILHKKVELDYVIINENEYPNKIHHSFSLYNVNSNLTEQERKDSFKVTMFKINGTDLTQESDKYKSLGIIEKKESTVYEYIITFERKLQNCKEHKVKLVFEYDVPISDITQVFKMTLPCKRLEHSIIINEDRITRDKWKVHANAFTSFFCSSESKDSGFKVEHKTDQFSRVNFENWIIPGAGYVAYFSKEV